MAGKPPGARFCGPYYLFFSHTSSTTGDVGALHFGLNRKFGILNLLDYIQFTLHASLIPLPPRTTANNKSKRNSENRYQTNIFVQKKLLLIIAENRENQTRKVSRKSDY